MITDIVDGLAMIGEGLGLSDAAADRFAAVGLYCLAVITGAWLAFLIVVVIR